MERRTGITYRIADQPDVLCLKRPGEEDLP
jgi:hypothetical protein